MVTKSSIRINRFDILDKMIKFLHNLHRDKLAWLKVDELSWRMFGSEISEEIFEALNLIKYNNLLVNGLSLSFYNVKMCMLLNSTNINIGFCVQFDSILELTFLNSKILFFLFWFGSKTQHQLRVSSISNYYWRIQKYSFAESR